MRWRRGLAASTLLLLACVPLAAATEIPTGEAPELPGVVLDDASSDAAAPTLLTAGTWRDTLGATGRGDDQHYFTYERTMAGSAVLVGVVAAGTLANDYVSVTVQTPEGEDCGSDDSTAGFDNPFGTFGALVVAGSSDPSDPCAAAAELRIRVDRTDFGTDNPLPVAVRVVEEAPLKTVEGLPTSAPDPRVDRPPSDGQPTPIDTGTTFTDAPLLEPGRYDVAVAEGTEGFWRVRLTWGQQLAVRLEIPRAEGRDRRLLDEYAEPAVELVPIDPMLDTFRDEVENADGSGSWQVDEDTVLTEGTAPLAFLNRADDTAGTVPGDYWVTVSVEPPDGHEPLDVPMVLAIAVTGDVGGAPQFPDNVLGPGGSEGPEGYDAATPYLVGDGEFAAEITLPGADDATDRAADDGSGSDTGTTLGLASGAAGLVCVALGVLLLGRRRRA